MPKKQNDPNKAIFWTKKEFKNIKFFKASFLDFSYTKHTHDEFCIGIIEEGIQTFSYKGKKYYAPNNTSIITVNPDTIHDGRAATENGYQYRMIYFEPDLISEILEEYGIIKKDLSFFKSPILSNKEIFESIKKALCLSEQENMLLESQNILYENVARIFSIHSEQAKNPKLLSFAQKQIQRSCNFIEENWDKNLSLEEIAKEAHLSRFHFLRLFKQQTGIAPYSFLLQLRLNKAKKMLEKGKSLSETALDCLFSDQSHLQRQFKKNFGLSPGDYKKAF